MKLTARWLTLKSKLYWIAEDSHETQSDMIHSLTMVGVNHWIEATLFGGETAKFRVDESVSECGRYFTRELDSIDAQISEIKHNTNSPNYGSDIILNKLAYKREIVLERMAYSTER